MVSRKRRRRSVSIVRTFALLGILAVLVGTGFAFRARIGSQDSRSFKAPATLALIADKRIRESSGIAASPTRPGVYFTLNDSGDSARIFSFNAKGVILRENKIRNAKNVDWEDMASATLNGRPYLFIGDIGDNAGRRSFITVYRVVEPTGRRCSVDQVYNLSYPDEGHNAETLLVNPANGDLMIVTKARTHPAAVFYLPRPTKSGSYLLKKLGDIEIESPFGAGKLITGGAWSHDGRHIVLRTYLAAYEYPADDPLHWFEKEPFTIRTNLELQGEAITYTPKDDGLVTTSEGSPCPVSFIPISG